MERASSLVILLSDREREVLALVADGRSNDAIAERLRVSTKTIEAITRSIFRKLDLVESADSNRRVQAAVLHVRHAATLAPAGSRPSRTTPRWRCFADASTRRRLDQHRTI